MNHPLLFPLLLLLLLEARRCSAYWLMAANNILTSQRLDPVVSPGRVSTHVHSVVGGSNFGLNTSTAALRASACTSVPIPEDRSDYWFPCCSDRGSAAESVDDRWSNGSFTSADWGSIAVSCACFGETGGPSTRRTDYLFNNTPGATTAFPDDVESFAAPHAAADHSYSSSGCSLVPSDPTLRTLDPSSSAQQAVTFLCLDFNGKSSRYNELPRGISCPSGIRSQINFPSCWNGNDTDSPDHKSHVAFLSTGPDNGTCSDPGFPVTLPRIFMEVYWISQVFEGQRKQAMTPSQPFVFAHGDPTGYGYHADFFNGWQPNVLQNALDRCNCNPYGDPTCCVSAGIFGLNQSAQCYITNSVDEPTLGTLDTLPGNNPIQGVSPCAVRAGLILIRFDSAAPCYQNYIDPTTPPILSPVSVYTTSTTPGMPSGTVATAAQTADVTQTANGSCIRPGAAQRSAPHAAVGVAAAAIVTVVLVVAGCF
ncbi:unnamed protein product [Mycena citricolor]|uniref:DUF1996 domain-containing protein n=1 Tax=Mycena citricolor TaxID=2018698 RepID=A0AAD2H7S5_9AGAR|nr:unnamed protein product [Mycena citricolor]